MTYQMTPFRMHGIVNSLMILEVILVTHVARAQIDASAWVVVPLEETLCYVTGRRKICNEKQI